MSKHWIAVDWGTTNLRCWVLDDENNLIKLIESDQGMSRLKPDDFEPVLLTLVNPFLNQEGLTQILACGMVGAKQGWQEAMYRQVPCTPNSAEIVKVTTNDQRLDVAIISGLSQPEPADVMRGEETQLAGLLLDGPDFSGVICMPGTHTKWVKMQNGQVLSFKSVMTGELFDLLCAKSTLSHSVGTHEFSLTHFQQQLLVCKSNPVQGVSNLFSLRAEDLLHQYEPSVQRAKLSAMLIGTELNAIAQFWQGTNVCLLASGKLANLYEKAFDVYEIEFQIADVEALTLKGLINTHQKMEELI